MSTELAQKEKTALSLAQTPMGLLQLAIEREGSIDVIERLAALQMQMLDREAKIAFTEAFEDFKRNVPAIVKDSVIVVNGQERGKFAKLDKVCDTLVPALLKVGITSRWKTRMAENGNVIVTCLLRHRMGHEEEGSTLGAGPDTSGSKNAVQACGSTVSYLERYTLVASCGIAIKDQDNVDSGKVAGMEEGVLLEWLDGIRQAPDIDKLKLVYAQAYKSAHDLGDTQAIKEIRAEYEKGKTAFAKGER
jgi:hypothetical protein